MAKETALFRSVLFLTFLLFISILSYAQVTVTGRISDPDGKPLPGATVQVKGTDTKTITKADGSFQLSVPSTRSILMISYVGYDPVEWPLNDQTDVSVGMKLSASTMTDIVVVGYGTQKKSDVTGALTSISAKTIQERPVTNVLQAMQGKAAGTSLFFWVP